MIQEDPRDIAQAFLETQELRPGMGLEFRSVEDRGPVWCVFFDKVFEEAVRESPSTLAVQVDKETGEASWLYQE